jgi:uncharacterized protein
VRRQIVIALGLIILLHTYVGLRLIPSLPLNSAGVVAAMAIVVLSCVSMPLGFFARSAKRRALADAGAWLGFTSMGLFSSLLVLTLLRDVILLATFRWVAPSTLASLAHVSALAVVMLAAVATSIGFVNARRRPQIVRVDIPIANLPSALEGFVIVQISDVHVGPTIKQAYVATIVDAVNALKPDVIAVTGDLVDGSVADLRAHVAPLARLKAHDGTYFVTGNHEYYSGARAWAQEVGRLGMRVLTNEHTLIHRGGAAVVLAGVTDWSAHHFEPDDRSDPVAALAGSPSDASVRVLLAHQPRSAPAAADAGFDLQLSGHTHGGQFWPWNHFVRFQQPFTAGLARLKQLWVYTSRGTGYWGPPKRFGAPSEITRLRLVRG